MQITIYGAFALLVMLLAGSAKAASPPGWVLISERNDIRVYVHANADSRLKTFRGVTRFKLADEYAMVALLNDYDAYPDWLHFVDSARELSRAGPRLRNMRFTTLLPWPLADREAVLESRVSQSVTDAGGSTVTVTLSNRPDRLPPNQDYIRFPALDGTLLFVRVPGDQVEVTYQLTLDAGGYIPAWLVNVLLRDAPYFTLERLRRVVHRPEYQGHYYPYLDLNGPGRPEEIEPRPPNTEN
ncbi:hypothetical protein CEK62_21650 (plasmid) [Alcanivorax sp. N3-2A]|nr:hypothetical protein CEK62_01455 [Alcanivorax sp. N3-2A]ASK36961.1 hypothetical protein CEK62_21650 [Alcanivorax sp. N3-2A]